MSSPTPYICSRCLRASRQLSSSRYVLTRRTYHESAAAHSIAPRRWPLSPTAVSRKTPNQPVTYSRLLSTSSALQMSSLETQATNNSDLPPATSTAPTTSPQAYTTHTLLNPRQDPETGEDMTIELTPRATKRLQQIMTKDSNPLLCLRVTVESGGCHGFQYLMSLEDISKVDEAEDVLFVGGGALPGGAEWRQVAEGRPKVVIDESSLELLKGSRVDYTMELIGSQFKIDNPKASSSCGCGTSFDIKV